MPPYAPESRDIGSADTLLDAITDQAIIVLDVNGHIARWHSGAVRLTGYHADEVVGCHISVLYAAADDAAREPHAALVAAASNGHATAEHSQQHKDGSTLPVSVAITAIRQAHDHVLLGFAAVIRERPPPGKDRDSLDVSGSEVQQVREDERHRIAQALHDDFGQQLIVLKMAVAELRGHLAQSGMLSVQATVLTDKLDRLVDGAVTSLRRIAIGLNPVILETLGFVPSLEWLVDDFAQRHRLAVHSRIEQDGPPLHEDAAMVLFRAAQEALTNVVRHAEASTVHVTLTRIGTHCVLKIEDDGRGGAPPPTALRGTSMGLRGMQEGVRWLDGSLHIDSPPGQGTRLTISVPLDRFARNDGA